MHLSASVGASAAGILRSQSSHFHAIQAISNLYQLGEAGSRQSQEADRFREPSSINVTMRGLGARWT